MALQVRGSRREDYVETGEFRKPREGECWLNEHGYVYSGGVDRVGERRIVVKKGSTVTSYAPLSLGPDPRLIENYHASPAYDV